MNGARQLSFWAADRDCSGQCGPNTLGDTLDSGSRNNLVGVVLVV